MTRLSWLRALTQGGATNLQQIWNVLSQNGNSGPGQNGSLETSLDVRLLQLFIATPADSGSADGDEWIGVPVSGGIAAVAADPADLLDAASRSLTLQVGLVQTPFEVVPKMIVNSEVPEKKPAEGFVGGWLETYLFYQSHMGGPPMFEFALGETDSWAGPPSGLDPRLDTIVLAGDFSAGFTLSSVAAGVTQMAVAGGNDYVLAVEDDFIGAGRLLTFDARLLGSANHVLFDGSAETDGRFAFFGSDANDLFLGGAGDDRFSGLGGADTLSGGAGADLFIYTAGGESSGAAYDMLADFDPVADRIDLPGTVAGFAQAIGQGTLSTASFGQDLSAVLGGLGANQAVFFAPDSGDLAGTVFLIVDGNGTAGYQDGEDYVFAIGGASLADLADHTSFFV